MGGIALAFAAAGVCRGHDTGYTVKVVVADRAQGHFEARFMTMPEDLRIVCEGEAPKLFEGDYVKVELDDKGFKLAGTKARCAQMKWLK